MGVYTTTKCGYCNERWEHMEGGKTPKIGSPFIKCSTCNEINKTGRILYRDASVFQKIFFWLGQSHRFLIYGLIPLIFGTYILFYESEFILFALIFLGSGVYYGYDFYKTSRLLRELENLYDENGGYLWSYQAY